MKIVKFSDIEPAAWDCLAALSSDAWLTHTSAWLNIEERFFAGANLSFGLIENGELVAIQPLYLNERAGMAYGERLLHSGIHRHTGLALGAKVDTATTKAVRKAAMAEIVRLGDLFDVDRIQLNSHNLAPQNRSPRREEIPFWVRDFGFQLGISFGPNGMTPCPGLATTNADQLVDLGVSEQDLFANLEDSCRRAVRKAEKSELQFEISSESARLDAYIELAKASAARTGEALPPFDYYREILRTLSGEMRAHVAFAIRRDAPVAGLILLSHKGAVNFLAGVSSPDMLQYRPNDFLHWNAILWAKKAGLDVYRFGPWFPDVPRDWPISKVSHFKTKFGSRSVPIIQGSLFRRPELYIANLTELSNSLKAVGRQPRGSSAGQAGASYIALHLRMFGLRDAGTVSEGAPMVLYRPGKADASVVKGALKRGISAVVVLPSLEFAEEFEAATTPRTVDSPKVLQACLAGPNAWKRLRTLHSYYRFKARDIKPVVADTDGEVVWFQRSFGGASIVFVGTDLASDLMRYRQGDPATTESRPAETRWGIPGERPNYLFDAQLAGEDPTERPADWWCETLADALGNLCGIKRAPMLPNGAPGAIVVTGDDDQAALHRYSQQRELLGRLPMTYFLHPLTKHSRKTLGKLQRNHRVELGLHPDALDQPDRYDELFAEQARWYASLTGSAARIVRNHGFLNDGYWKHATSWMAHGVTGSSNLPGFDGQILNGSLLPAPLSLDGQLTDHWSILTAVGDGVVFVNGWDDEQSARCIRELADRIRKSKVPGVIVLNLHPENVEKTGGMHRAAKEIAASGFVPWTFSECIDWFAEQVRSLPSRSAAFDGARTPPEDGTKKLSARNLVRSLVAVFRANKE